MNYYIVYDGRANYDVDRAAILENIGESTQANAVRKFKRNWGGHDAVLFEYDINGDRAINGRMVNTQ